MSNSTVTVPTVKVEGTHGAAEAEILTPQAVEFLGALSANFAAERQRMIAARHTEGESLRPDHLADILPDLLALLVDASLLLAPRIEHDLSRNRDTPLRV